MLDISYHTLQAYLRYADRTSPMSSTQLPGWATAKIDDQELGDARPLAKPQKA